MNTFKIGDKVVAKRPDRGGSSNGVLWTSPMDRHDGKILTVVEVRAYSVGVKETPWSFDFEWLSKHIQFKGNRQ